MVLCRVQLLTPARFHSLVEAVKEAFPQGTASYTDFIKVKQTHTLTITTYSRFSSTSSFQPCFP
jgi:hypothetical protein